MLMLRICSLKENVSSISRSSHSFVKPKYCNPVWIFFQALQNGFFSFDTFDVYEYEHYEVSVTLQTVISLIVLVKFQIYSLFIKEV